MASKRRSPPQRKPPPATPRPRVPRPGVILLGATGFTGRLTAHALSRLGLPLVLAGRRPEALERVAGELSPRPETRPLDLGDGAGLRGLLEEFGVVVNTVGPFTRLGEPVVRAAVAAGTHYLDTTGETGFMRRMLGYHEEAWRRRVAVVPGMATVPGVADLMASWGEVPGVERVRVFYQAGLTAPSRGTLRSSLDVLGQPRVVFREGEWGETRRLETVRAHLGGRGRVGISMPGPEVVTIPRHLKVREASVWALLPPPLGPLGGLLDGWTLPSPPESLRGLADRALERLPAPASEESDLRSRVDVWVHLEGGGNHRWLRGRAQGVYMLTAHLIAHSVRRILQKGPRTWGVLPPAKAVYPGVMLEELAHHGLRVEEE